MKCFLPLYVIVAIALIFNSCGEDDFPQQPSGGGELVLITTMNYTLTPTDGGDVVVLRYIDFGDDGETEAVIEGGELTANTEYNGRISIATQGGGSNIDVNQIIEEFDEDYQAFFSSTLEDLSFAYADVDTNGNPLGIKNTLATGESGSGSITIDIRFQPDKFASGVESGDVTNAGGSVYLQVTLPVDVL